MLSGPASIPPSDDSGSSPINSDAAAPSPYDQEDMATLWHNISTMNMDDPNVRDWWKSMEMSSNSLINKQIQRMKEAQKRLRESLE